MAPAVVEKWPQDATNDADVILRADLANDLSYSQVNVPAQNITRVFPRLDDVKR